MEIQRQQAWRLEHTCRWVCSRRAESGHEIGEDEVDHKGAALCYPMPTEENTDKAGFFFSCNQLAGSASY